MSVEIAIFFGPLQSLLAWFQRNQEIKDDKKTLALNAMNKAIIATKKYKESVNINGHINRALEFELAELWACAATEARHASGLLAEKLHDKSKYWSEPLKWSSEEVSLKKIDLESIQYEINKLLTNA